MTTLFIHIGFHKTGSTSLQYALKKHQGNLEKENFSFLAENNSGNSSDLISVNLNRSNAAVKISDRFFSLLKRGKGNNAIISAEHLSFIEDESELVKLRNHCLQSYSEVKIIAYIRKQHRLALSFKRQAAKQPHINAAPSSQLCGHTLNSPIPELTYTLVNYLKFDEKYKLWSNVFNEDNVIFKLYDKNFLFKSCICKDFSKVLGVENELPSENVNEGFGLIKSEIKHYLITTKAPEEIVKFFNKLDINDADYPQTEKNLNYSNYHSFFVNHNKNLPLSKDEIEALNSLTLESYRASAIDISLVVRNLLVESKLNRELIKKYFYIIDKRVL